MQLYSRAFYMEYVFFSSFTDALCVWLRLHTHYMSLIIVTHIMWMWWNVNWHWVELIDSSLWLHIGENWSGDLGYTLTLIHNQPISCIFSSCPRPLGSPVQEKNKCEEEIQRRKDLDFQSLIEQQQIFPCIHYVQALAVLNGVCSVGSFWPACQCVAFLLTILEHPLKCLVPSMRAYKR